MGKSFHGPFRLTGSVDVELGRDGEVFVTFRCDNNDVIGAVLDAGSLVEICDRFQSVLSSFASTNGSRALEGHLLLSD